MDEVEGGRLNGSCICSCVRYVCASTKGEAGAADGNVLRQMHIYIAQIMFLLSKLRDKVLYHLTIIKNDTSN